MGVSFLVSNYCKTLQILAVFLMLPAMRSGQLETALPKVDLHRHLEGSVRFATLLELLRTRGVTMPLNASKKFLVTEPMSDLAAVLDAFMTTQSVLDSEEVLTRIAYEAVEDAAAEGIRILELRYAPTFIRHNHKHLSFSAIHQAILAGLVMAKEFPVATGLICIFQRNIPIMESERVCNFLIENKKTFIGADLADSEVGYPSKLFVPIFERCQNEDIPITIHAGETPDPQSIQNVKEAIELLGARRIGHGLQIAQDPQVMKFVADRGIPLEICPYSNYLTRAIPDLQSHPIRKLMDAGVRVTVNSDDPGIFNSNLTRDYEILREQYGFSEQEFDQCKQLAAEASFIAHEEKQKVWPRPLLKSL
jgi:adenosine deaminase